MSCTVQGVRTTHSVVQAALALTADIDGIHWGYALAHQAGIRPGVLYPILTRMLAEGWITDGWEDPATISGRPPRRYYQLTDPGKTALAGLLAKARQDPRFAAIFAGEEPK